MYVCISCNISPNNDEVPSVSNQLDTQSGEFDHLAVLKIPAPIQVSSVVPANNETNDDQPTFYGYVVVDTKDVRKKIN